MPGLEVMSVSKTLCLISSSEVESKLDLFWAIRLNQYVQISKSNFMAESRDLPPGQSPGSWQQRQDVPNHMCCEYLGDELCNAQVWCTVF